jgi:hypothetical protein
VTEKWSNPKFWLLKVSTGRDMGVFLKVGGCNSTCNGIEKWVYNQKNPNISLLASVGIALRLGSLRYQSLINHGARFRPQTADDSRGWYQKMIQMIYSFGGVVNLLIAMRGNN